MITDGRHRLSGGYVEYSRTTSGWTIFHNAETIPPLRWRIAHPVFGERHFSEHDDILKWTLNHVREQYKAGLK